MANLPGFLTGWGETPDEEPVADQVLMEKPLYDSRTTFTVKDWACLQLLGVLAAQGDYTPSNAKLGKLLEMTNGAVSARIKRLATLGLIEVVHFNATDTGKNNRREIFVKSIPAKPWSPE